ncbi:hypothetical protein ACTHSI_27755, partial [Neisseria sp. P0001.S004]
STFFIIFPAMSKLWLVWTVLYSKPTGLELYSYSETFAKKPFPRQPKPKRRFSAAFVSNIH